MLLENRRTAVIAAPPKLAAKIANILQYGQYEVVGQFYSGNEALRKVQEAFPELVVSAYRLNDMMGAELMAEVVDLCAIVLLASQAEKNFLGTLHGNALCLASPIDAWTLLNTADMLTANFQSPRRTRTKRSEEDKAVIALAKRHIQLVYNVDEPDAHRRLQKWSMDSGKTLVEVAHIVLEGI